MLSDGYRSKVWVAVFAKRPLRFVGPTFPPKGNEPRQYDWLLPFKQPAFYGGSADDPTIMVIFSTGAFSAIPPFACQRLSVNNASVTCGSIVNRDERDHESQNVKH